MDFTDDDFFRAVESIFDLRCSTEALHLLNYFIEHRGPSELVQALIGRELINCQSEVEAIKQTMFKLESLGNTSQSIACIMMAELWSMANTHLLHDVCDSIDLWICDCNSVELTKHLKAMALSEIDSHKRHRFKLWLEERDKC